MKPTTLTTCDDNVPSPQLFTDAASLDAALLDHYKGVWAETEADGPCPESWKEIQDELRGRDLLRDRHIAHIHTHELFKAAA